MHPLYLGCPLPFATWSTHPSRLGSGARRACPWPSTVCPLVAALMGCPDSPIPITFLRAGSRTSSLGIWEFNKALQNEGGTLKVFILYKLYVMKGSVQNACHFLILLRRVSLWLSRKTLQEAQKTPTCGIAPKSSSTLLKP